jgi:hypothetical protein
MVNSERSNFVFLNEIIFLMKKKKIHDVYHGTTGTSGTGVIPLILDLSVFAPVSPRQGHL